MYNNPRKEGKKMRYDQITLGYIEDSFYHYFICDGDKKTLIPVSKREDSDKE